MFLAVAALVVAGAAATAGAGTTQQSTAPDYLDGSGDGAGVAFAGQVVYAVGGPIAAADPGDGVDLRRADAFSGGDVRSSTFVEELTVVDTAEANHPSAVRAASDRAVRIETDDLAPGNYFLHGGDVDGLPRRPAESNTVELVGSTLSVSFADGEVTDAGDGAVTDLDIASNRGRYSLNVSADGDLDETELLRLLVTDRNVDTSDGFIDDDTFAASDEVTVADVRLALVELREQIHVADGERIVINDDTATVSVDGAAGEVSLAEAIATDANPFDAVVYADDVDDADERVALFAITDREHAVSFAGVDPGSYTFRFALTDAPVSADGSFSVSESDPDAEFGDPDGTPTPTPEETPTPTPEETPTPTPEETQTPEETPADTPSPTPDETQTPADTPEPAETDEPTDDDTPGFGAIAALVALLAAALLATRRRP
ncbi:hypothetical protein JCM17823_10650 [Halorubrum gandharaense]